jgi:anti-sigma factor (TIGR02949 family)
MNCDEIARRLDEYLDGELESREAERFRMHLESCEECRRKLEFEQILRGLIRRAVPRREVPLSVRTRVLSAVHEPEGASRRFGVGGRGARFAPPLSMAAAVAVLLLIVGTWWWTGRARGAVIVRAAVTYHQGLVEGSRSVDMESSSPAEIAGWLREKTGLPVREESLRRLKREPCGACCCTRFAHPVGFVVYEHGIHCVVLAVASEDAARSLREGRREIVNGHEIIVCAVAGTNLVVWFDRPLSCCLASSMPADDLIALASSTW